VSRQARIELDEAEPAYRVAKDAIAQDAEPRANFDYLVVRPKLRHRDDSIRDRALHQEVLPSRLARTHTGRGEDVPWARGRGPAGV
jgi:hypothetical protein